MPLEVGRAYAFPAIFHFQGRHGNQAGETRAGMWPRAGKAALWAQAGAARMPALPHLRASQMFKGFQSQRIEYLQTKQLTKD